MQRTSCPVIAAAIAALIGGVQWASAALSTMPTAPPAAPAHIELGRPSLPPVTYTMFCLRYQAECRPRRSFRGGPIRLTEERWADLREINRAVNLSIAPVRNELGLAGEEWTINPASGDCNDYAVSKRHELLQRGWPARVLLLSEVAVGSGEHHLVLLVRTRSGDLVLDNLTAHIKPWSRAPYRWVRVQMPSHNRMWATVGRTRAEETAHLDGKSARAEPGLEHFIAGLRTRSAGSRWSSKRTPAAAPSPFGTRPKPSYYPYYRSINNNR